MEDTVTTQPALKTSADFQAAIDRCLAEIKRLRDLMARDQAAIEESRQRTRAMLDRLKVQ